MKKKNVIGVILVAVGCTTLVKLTQWNERRKHKKELQKISNDLREVAEKAKIKLNEDSESR